MAEQNLLQQNIARILGIEGLPLEEQAAFLAEIGDTIFQSSLMRFTATLSDEQQFALEQYLETEPEPEAVLQHLLETYEQFKTILEESVIEFKEDALAILKEIDTSMPIIDVDPTT